MATVLSGSGLELLLENLSGECGVGLALAKLHDLTLEEVERGTLSGLEIFHALGVGPDNLVADFFDGSGITDLGQSFLVHDGGGSGAGGMHVGKHILGDFAADLSGIDEFDQFHEMLRLKAQVAEGLLVLGELGPQIVDHPVGNPFGIFRSGGGSGEVVAQRDVVLKDLSVGWRQLELGNEAEFSTQGQFHGPRFDLLDPGFIAQPPLPFCGSALVMGCKSEYVYTATVAIPACAPYTEGWFTETFDNTVRQDCFVPYDIPIRVHGRFTMNLGASPIDKFLI